MIIHVIKKSGDKESFDEDKLKKSIMAACQDADLAEDRIRELVVGISQKIINNFDGKEEVATSELRDFILRELDDMESSAAEAWRKFETEHKS